jgi:two-component system sensor histidine kinase DesK
MTAVPTVSRWWSSRSAPQRIDLYTRWSFYTYLGAGLPLFALAVLGSATEEVDTTAVVLFLVGSLVTAALTVRLAGRGLDAHRHGGAVAPALLAGALGAALLTGAAGAWAFSAGDDVTPAAAWGMGLPLAMAVTACSTLWSSRQLVAPSLAAGALSGAAALVDGGPWVAGVTIAVVFAAAVYALALAFRFSVWVLDVVLEMDRTRGVQLQLAVAEERLRFARDLHDVMGRNLAAIAVKSQLAGELVRRNRPEAGDEVADISRIAEESLREVREVVRGYRSTDLSSELAGARSVLRAAGVACTVHGEEGAATLPEQVQTALGWVVREAVTNVLRHSDAADCSIELVQAGGEVRLTVLNDGVPAGADGTAGGSGLAGLRERLSGAGGRLVTASDGDRFRLTATLPTGGAG